MLTTVYDWSLEVLLLTLWAPFHRHFCRFTTCSDPGVFMLLCARRFLFLHCTNSSRVFISVVKKTVFRHLFVTLEQLLYWMWVHLWSYEYRRVLFTLHAVLQYFISDFVFSPSTVEFVLANAQQYLFLILYLLVIWYFTQCNIYIIAHCIYLCGIQAVNSFNAYFTLYRYTICKCLSVVVVLLSTASIANYVLCQKTRVIALLCGIKISAVHCLVLSQSTHVTDRQNYDS